MELTKPADAHRSDRRGKECCAVRGKPVAAARMLRVFQRERPPSHHEALNATRVDRYRLPPQILPACRIGFIPP
jgi:hypothetical protein